MPESYKPGQREKRYGVNPRLTNARKAWINCYAGSFIILKGDEDEADSGADVVLFHPREGRIPDVTIRLTELTKPELDAFRQLINDALDWAEPVVEQRDKEAEDAWNAGDDSFSRSYRPVPTVVYRERPLREYREGVQQRLEGVPQGGRGGRVDPEGRVRGAGDELAQPDSEYRESQDNGASSDDPQGLRQVDGTE